MNNPSLVKTLTRLNVVKTNEAKPPCVVIYGPPKIGKTTFAANSDKPIFLCTEDGLGQQTVDHFPLITSYDQVIDHIDALVQEDHEYRTVILDSLDWLENIIWSKVAEDHGKRCIEDIGFAKGYIFALNYWREILNGFSYLRNNKGMIVVLIAHSQIKPFNSPLTEPYDQFSLKMHDKARAVVEEWADCILFAGYKIVTRGDKSKGDHVRAIGSGERILYTTSRPGFIAGNRFNLPPEMPLLWDTFIKAIGNE
jgi:hypothetical protein